jgi:16S rRNA (guanine966-N2)-methyltransferase
MVKRNAGRVQGSVRIIAGEWRGRRIAVPAGTSVRPTPDRVRETVFNWLRDSLPGARCLDLYAGTGVLGFEALSRGAAAAWFVERDEALVEALSATGRQLGATPQIVRRDALAFLRDAVSTQFDVVFLDPPYAEALDPLLELLPRWLAPQAQIYIERPRSAAGLPAVPGALWLKQSYAGAVEYGLLRFDEATMQPKPPSEAQPP